MSIHKVETVQAEQSRREAHPVPETGQLGLGFPNKLSPEDFRKIFSSESGLSDLTDCKNYAAKAARSRHLAPDSTLEFQKALFGSLLAHGPSQAILSASRTKRLITSPSQQLTGACRSTLEQREKPHAERPRPIMGRRVMVPVPDRSTRFSG